MHLHAICASTQNQFHSCGLNGVFLPVLTCGAQLSPLFTSTRDQRVESIREHQRATLHSFHSLPSLLFCPVAVHMCKIKRESTPGRGKGYRSSQCKVPLICITLSISKYSIFSLERCSRLSATHAATIARNGPYLSSWQKCIQTNKFRKLFWQLNQPCFKWILQQEVNHGVLMPTIRLWFVLSCRTPWCRMAVVIVEPFRALCMARLCCDIRQRNDRATLRHDWPKSSV